jgi:hypothetical protein
MRRLSSVNKTHLSDTLTFTIKIEDGGDGGDGIPWEIVVAISVITGVGLLALHNFK